MLDKVKSSTVRQVVSGLYAALEKAQDRVFLISRDQLASVCGVISLRDSVVSKIKTYATVKEMVILERDDGFVCIDLKSVTSNVPKKTFNKCLFVDRHDKVAFKAGKDEIINSLEQRMKQI